MRVGVWVGGGGKGRGEGGVLGGAEKSGGAVDADAECEGAGAGEVPGSDEGGD